MIGLRRFVPRGGGNTKALPLVPSDGRIGWLEGVHAGWLRGWAHDPGCNGRPARITVTSTDAQGRRLGEGAVLMADHYRADVQAAGHGRGICGFALWLGALRPDGIEARWADSGEPLPGSPWQAKAGIEPLEGWRGTRMAQFAPPLPGSATLTGFALDTAEPGLRLRVELVAAGRSFGPVQACRHAPAARSLGTDTFHGFHLIWDPTVLANGCEPELRDARDGAVLLRLNRTWARSTGLV